MSGTSTGSNSRKKRLLTFSEKVDVIQKFTKGRSTEELARHFGYSRPQIENILEHKKYILLEWMDMLRKNKTAQSVTSSLMVLEVIVYERVQRARCYGGKLTDNFILRTAKKIAHFLHILDFRATNEWCVGFKTKYKILDLGPSPYCYYPNVPKKSLKLKDVILDLKNSTCKNFVKLPEKLPCDPLMLIENSVWNALLDDLDDEEELADIKRLSEVNIVNVEDKNKERKRKSEYRYNHVKDANKKPFKAKTIENKQNCSESHSCDIAHEVDDECVELVEVEDELNSLPLSSRSTSDRVADVDLEFIEVRTTQEEVDYLPSTSYNTTYEVEGENSEIIEVRIVNDELDGLPLSFSSTAFQIEDADMDNFEVEIIEGEEDYSLCSSGHTANNDTEHVNVAIMKDEEGGLLLSFGSIPVQVKNENMEIIEEGVIKDKLDCLPHSSDSTVDDVEDIDMNLVEVGIIKEEEESLSYTPVNTVDEVGNEDTEPVQVETIKEEQDCSLSSFHSSVGQMENESTKLVEVESIRDELECIPFLSGNTDDNVTDANEGLIEAGTIKREPEYLPYSSNGIFDQVDRLDYIPCPTDPLTSSGMGSIELGIVKEEPNFVAPTSNSAIDQGKDGHMEVIELGFINADPECTTYSFRSTVDHKTDDSSTNDEAKHKNIEFVEVGIVKSKEKCKPCSSQKIAKDESPFLPCSSKGTKVQIGDTDTQPMERDLIKIKSNSSSNAVDKIRNILITNDEPHDLQTESEATNNAEKRQANNLMSYEAAIEHLKLLEGFVLSEEDSISVNIISQLVELFKANTSVDSRLS